MSMNGQKDLTAGVPLPLERAERTAAEEQAPAAEQSFFRGEPIAWLTVPTTKTVVTANVFGDSEASERPGRKNNFILYGGKQYKREDFYQMAFR